MIAGTLGGRQLLAPKGWKVRPTPERVREAMFSALGDISGSTVADLYCGTGALGIEALSRGADRAVLVDRDTRPALGNLHNLDLTDRADLIRAEASEWVGRSKGSFDLIFIDPPYRIAPEISAALDRGLSGLLAPEGRVVVESGVGRPLELSSLETVRERRYGRTLVTFLRSNDPNGTE